MIIGASAKIFTPAELGSHSQLAPLPLAVYIVELVCSLPQLAPRGLTVYVGSVFGFRVRFRFLKFNQMFEKFLISENCEKYLDIGMYVYEYD